MASDFTHRILHKKDERGVILESGVFGPDDEVPEGFGAAEYESTVFTTADAPPVEESKLTRWEGVDLSTTVDAIKESNEAQEGSTDPAGLRSSGAVGEDEKISVEGTVVRTDDEVTADDGTGGLDTSQTVDAVKAEADAQEGATDPGGEKSSAEDEDGDEKPRSRRRR